MPHVLLLPVFPSRQRYVGCECFVLSCHLGCARRGVMNVAVCGCLLGTSDLPGCCVCGHVT
jgi:hypothetical protein